MLTELRRRKITRGFQNYDFNKDGYVERADYERAAQGVADYLGLAPGSADHERHTADFMAGWEFIQQAADSDGDNRVTLDEFISATSLVLSQPEVFESLVMHTARQLMTWLDKDKDGRVARAEFLGAVPLFGQTLAEGEETFRHLDRDEDGYLNLEEWIRNTEEFFMSDDPDAPGNWLNGPY